jgi:hypothetical protein
LETENKITAETFKMGLAGRLPISITASSEQSAEEPKKHVNMKVK